MQLQISVREANQHLSRYLAHVEQGDEVVITRRGAPIAKLAGISERPELTPEKAAARERLRTRLTKGYRLGGIRVARDEIHERNQWPPNAGP
ncbi:type II toxin-antitoxin system Phd/YefM family antitoxin [Candidatus Thiosymbion oneisti]|uniref:type II toxin-antitoxin system Phd/YefM family antitoxin n=1 Tax=Candidatus Thiosymbion oneisti TaxID=589554 RepID=UPI000B7C70B9|nr:type II toxin-antitoxin system prevent-host-death family antitoxin [Candidatus Thiosymbion oneisti]